MHLNEVFTYLSAFVLGGIVMEHYNRDNFERNNTGRDLYNRTSRNSSNTPKRKDFVVSFIASAIVGSALGLFYKNKVYKKTDELRDKEQDLRNKVLNYKEQAENTVNSVRDRVENFRNRSKDGLTSDELQAQKVAIQREVSDNNLSDQSPEAQEIQEAKLEATKDDFEQQNKPSATELTAQQNAIQQESKLADQSPEAQEIQEAKAESHKEDSQEASHIESDKKPSAEEIAIAQTAIKKESSDNDLADPTTKEGKNEDAHQKTQAKNLATAAKTKNDKITNDSQVAKNTNDLTSESSVPKSADKEVPNLVTKKNENDTGSSDGSFANRLATAAKAKKSKLTKGSKESQLTEALLAEPALPKGKKNNNVPNLVTQTTKQSTNSKKGQSSTSKEDKVNKSQESATFDKGVVTHENSIKGTQKSNSKGNKTNAKSNKKANTSKKQSNTPKQNNRTQKQQNQSNNNQQKVEKANSKIEKRTFND